MNCRNCGIILSEGYRFCPNCATPIEKDNVIQSMNSLDDVNSQMINYSSPVMQNQIDYNNYQNPMNNGNNMGGNYGGKSNTKRGVNPIVIIVAVVLVVVGLGIVGLMNISSIIKGLNGSKNEKTTVSEGIQTVSKEEANVTSKVSVGNVAYEVPVSLITEVESDVLYISDKDSEWYAEIETENMSYDTFLQNSSVIQQSLQNAGMTATVPVEKQVSGRNYLVVEIQCAGEKGIFGITKLDETNVVAVTLVREDNEIDYSILETINTVVETATLQQQTLNAEAGIDVEMSIFSNIKKKTSKKK